MKVAELVLSYLRVLAWPAVVISLGFLFRNQISALIGRVEEASAFGASFRLAKRAEQAEKASFSSPDRVTARSGVPAGEESEPRPVLATEEVVDVLRAWQELEETARRAGDQMGVANRHRPLPVFIAERMAANGWVSSDTVRLARELTQARNELIHENVDVSSATARSLVQSIETLRSIFQVALNNH